MSGNPTPRCNECSSQRLAAAFAMSILFLIAGCGEEPTAPSPGRSNLGLAATADAALEFRQVSAGLAHTCGVTMDNLAYCWGSNAYGQIGDGSSADRLIPTSVAGEHRFSEISVGVDHSCGVTLEKRIYCWGRNGEGQGGDGSFGHRSMPTPVATALSFRSVDAGHVHTCAIEDLTNRAYCWGNNLDGALGDGTNQTRGTPVPVAGGLRWLQLSAGSLFTCGVDTGHRAYCWGKNQNGQLGDGTTGARTRPIRVAGGISFRQVSAGNGSHSCGVSVTDVTYCWGWNAMGQLGDGRTVQRLRPRAIASQNTWSQVSAGSFHTCALTLSQRAWCWGDNTSGELGNGTAESRRKPVLVGEGMPFRQVIAGYNHSCGVARLRQGYCWGLNSSGQLGAGDKGEHPSPTQVSNPAE